MSYMYVPGMLPHALVRGDDSVKYFVVLMGKLLYIVKICSDD